MVAFRPSLATSSAKAAQSVAGSVSSPENVIAIWEPFSVKPALPVQLPWLGDDMVTVVALNSSGCSEGS
jgi:hypothetical protein